MPTPCPSKCRQGRSVFGTGASFTEVAPTPPVLPDVGWPCCMRGHGYANRRTSSDLDGLERSSCSNRCPAPGFNPCGDEISSEN